MKKKDVLTITIRDTGKNKVTLECVSETGIAGKDKRTAAQTLALGMIQIAEVAFAEFITRKDDPKNLIG